MPARPAGSRAPAPGASTALGWRWPRAGARWHNWGWTVLSGAWGVPLMHHTLSPWKVAASGSVTAGTPWVCGEVERRTPIRASQSPSRGGGCGAASLLGEGTAMLQGAGGVPVSLWPQEKKKNLKAGDDPSHLWPRRVPSRYQEDTRLSPPGSAALAVPLPRVGRGRRGGTEGGGCWQRGAGLPWLGEVAEAFSVTDLPGWDRGCEGQGLPCSPHVGLTAAVPCLRRAEMKGARRKKNLLLQPL